MAEQHLRRREQRRLVREVRAEHRRQRRAQDADRRQLCAQVGHDWRDHPDRRDREECVHCGEQRQRFNKRRTPPWTLRWSAVVYTDGVSHPEDELHP